MSTRYSREVSKRVLALASNAATIDEFAVSHQGHAAGDCVECDAHRVLAQLAADGFSLHKLRRSFGGNTGARDPLETPLIGSWCVTFPSPDERRRAWDRALDDNLGMVMPKLDDLDDPLSLQLLVGVGYDEVEVQRRRVADWADAFGGAIVEEEIRLRA